MEQIRVVGLDIAKSVFQVHGVNGEGAVVVRRQLTRSRVVPFFGSIEPCRIGIEACATSHFWARELGALGHDVKLMPPAYVKPYVKRQKNDAADAEAICEAVTRPTMRFVTVKAVEQQGIMVLHRVRELLMSHRVRLSNAIRGHMAEFGLIAPIGRIGLQRLIETINDETDERVPPGARLCIKMLVVGAMAVIRYAQRNGTRRPWLVQLMARRTTKIAAVALANKTVRMVWAIMISGERYREPVALAA